MPFPEDQNEIFLPENPPAGSAFVYIGDNSKMVHTQYNEHGLDFNFGDNTGVAIGIAEPGGVGTGHPEVDVVSVNNIDGLPFTYPVMRVKNLDVPGTQPGTLYLGVNTPVPSGAGYDWFNTRIAGQTVVVDPNDGLLSVGAAGAGAKYRVAVGGRDIGTGLLRARRLTAAGTAVGTAEAASWTLPSDTYYANRAYEVRGQLSISATSSGVFGFPRLRKTNVGGMLLHEYARTWCGLASTFAVAGSATFVVGNADVTAALCFTLQYSAGGGQFFGDPSPAGSNVHFVDVGAAADYLAGDPNMAVLV